MSPSRSSSKTRTGGSSDQICSTQSGLQALHSGFAVGKQKSRSPIRKRDNRTSRTLRSVKDLVTSKVGFRRSASSPDQSTASDSNAVNYTSLGKARSLSNKATATSQSEELNRSKMLGSNASPPLNAIDNQPKIRRNSWMDAMSLDGAGRLPPIQADAIIPVHAFPVAGHCYDDSPHTFGEPGLLVDSPAPPETPLFDISKCTAEIERQRAVLRQKVVYPKKFQEICDHIYNRERIEKSTSPMGLEEIIETRFDKLLEDVLETNYKEYQIPNDWWLRDWLPENYFIDVLIPHAKRLQAIWLKRFGSEYVEIDKRRRRNLLSSCGPFHGIAFNSRADNDEERFVVDESHRIAKADVVGAQCFKPGVWWLNEWCAFRDGIVGDPNKPVTQDSEGAVTTLALLHGVEVDGSEVDTYNYTAEVPGKNMMAALLSQRGRPLRLLRGYELESKYAPEAGLRYDGLYKVDSYSIKLVKHHTRVKEADMYHLKICLKKNQGEISPDELAHIPSPKQIDDWKILGKLLATQAHTVKEELQQKGPRPGYNTPLAGRSGLNSVN